MTCFFPSAVASLPTLAEKILFYTEGGKLVVEESPAFLELKALEKKGARIIACSTCFDYCGLKEKIAVGEVGGMPTILEAMLEADEVLTV